MSRHTDKNFSIENASSEVVWDWNSNTQHKLLSLLQSERSHHSGGKTIPDCFSAVVGTTAQLAGRCELGSFYQVSYLLRYLALGEMWKEVLPVEISAYFPYCLLQSWAQGRLYQVFLKKKTKQGKKLNKWTKQANQTKKEQKLLIVKEQKLHLMKQQYRKNTSNNSCVQTPEKTDKSRVCSTPFFWCLGTGVFHQSKL